MRSLDSGTPEHHIPTYEEVVKIIRKAQNTAGQIIDEHVKILHVMSEELVKYETIDDEDIKRILDGKKVISRKYVNNQNNQSESVDEDETAASNIRNEASPKKKVTRVKKAQVSNKK